jgi:hypothetical protein
MRRRRVWGGSSVLPYSNGPHRLLVGSNCHSARNAVALDPLNRPPSAPDPATDLLLLPRGLSGAGARGRRAFT